MKIALWFLLLPLFVGGCATSPQLPERRASILDFIEDGKTTRADALQKLGEPTGEFQNQKILTYRLSVQQNTKDLYPVTREQQCFTYPRARTGIEWPMWVASANRFATHVPYSLVLVFDEAGVLRRHTLVDVKAEPSKEKP
jgi:hypothetical protein